MSAEFFKTYFPNLSQDASEQLVKYAALLREWNTKINLVSRKDIDSLELHHIAPCVVLAEALSQVGKKPYTVWDIGTGGGLPGLPVAILCPHLRCVLIDSTAKKIGAVQDMVNRLGLKNVTCRAERVENIRETPDIIVGRGVAVFPEFLKMAHFTARSLRQVYYLTGAPEMPFRVPGWTIVSHALADKLPSEHFAGKVLVVAKGR